MKLVKKLAHLSVFTFMLFGSTFSFAELNVVSDYGGNAMGEFYDMLDPQDEYSDVQQQQLMPENVKIDEGVYLPVHSRLLTPGRFQAYNVDYPTLQPFIIVGYDNLSIEWLKARQDDFEAMNGVVGVVVNVDDVSQFNTLKSLTTIPLYAMAGDELAEKFQITHYPALITNKSVEQ